MNASRKGPDVTSVRDLYAIAWQMETDAIERYEMLAGQMETHNNLELAQVFKDLARAEGIHAAEIERMAGGPQIRQHALQVARWPGESPEAAELADAHYLMTRADALRMALASEERALAFFENVVETSSDPQLRKLAEQFAEEEADHVGLCRRLIGKYQETGGLGDEDPALGQD
ncbi:MAG: ferritin family protein [Gammaproteobacteria bacterium]|nr:ferritin family protein [Gammaproteobacteria bacterium]